MMMETTREYSENPAAAADGSDSSWSTIDREEYDDGASGFQFISIDSAGETPQLLGRGLATLDAGADTMLMGSGFNAGFKTQLKRMLSSEDDDEEEDVDGDRDDDMDADDARDDREEETQEECEEAPVRVPTSGWYAALSGPDSSDWATPTPLAPNSFLDSVREEEEDEEAAAAGDKQRSQDAAAAAPRVGSLPISIPVSLAAGAGTSRSPDKRHHSDPVAIPARAGEEAGELPVSESMLDAMLYVKAARLRHVSTGASAWHARTRDLLREVEGDRGSPLSARSSFSELSDAELSDSDSSDFEDADASSTAGHLDDDCFDMEL